MITAISLNPAIDKTLILTNLKRGEVNRLESVREDIGGKGINVAKILNKLSVPVQVYGFLGKQNKPYVEKLLINENLSHYFLEAKGFTRTNTKLVELDKGITTDLNEQGFLITEEQMEQFKALLLKNASQSDFMVFSGSIPKGLSDETYRNLISFANRYTKTVLDADKALLLKGIHAKPYMIKPNIHELETAFGIKFTSDTDIISFCRSLAKKHNIKLILVSMGEKGSLLLTETEGYKALPVKVEVKSTVGAGDSMIAGMLYGITKGMTDQDSLAFATACGTLAVTKAGTMSLPLEEIKEILKKVHINKLY